MQTLISLDQLHCHRKSDVTSAEPYLLTAFFKIDGDTIVYDRADDGREGLFLKGTCTFAGTSGSHGDLGTRDVEVGDDMPIPSALGELEQEINKIIPKLGPMKQRPDDKDIADLKANVHAAVKRAIKAKQGWFRNILNLFNGDVLIDADYFLAND